MTQPTARRWPTAARALVRTVPLVPATAFLVLLMVVPLGVLFSYGFLGVDGEEVRGGLTFENYASLLASEGFRALLMRTFGIAVLVTLLSLLFGYPIAWTLTRTRGWVRTTLLLLVATPLLTSTLVRTFAWIVILGQNGPLSRGLVGLGILDEPPSFLFGVGAVIVGMTQVMLPFMVFPLMSAIQGVPSDTQQAASNLGAGFIRTFFTVLLPQTVPGIAAGTTLVFALSFTEFTVAILLGGGSFGYAAIYVYDAMTSLLDWGRGAAASSLMLLISLATIFVINTVSQYLTRWSKAAR